MRCLLEIQIEMSSKQFKGEVGGRDLKTWDWMRSPQKYG